jgi:hypothetical protein
MTVWLYVNFAYSMVNSGGVYDFPPDIAKSIKELFEECAKIRSIVPANSITGIISRE